VKSEKLRTVNNSVLVLHQYVAACFKGVEDHGPGIAQLDLKDWEIILPPPFLARRSVILAELKQMAEDGQRTWDLGNASDFWNIRRTRPLRKAFCQVAFTWIRRRIPSMEQLTQYKIIVINTTAAIPA
jgi:hypothetical protein